MTTLRRVVLLTIALSLAPLARAQEGGKSSEGPPRADQPEPIKLHLMDGSVLTGRIGLKEFTVETAYGTLKVPLTEVRSLTPGLESHPEMGARIGALIEKLGSSDFAEREAAQKELSRMGWTIRGELAKYAKDPDAERRTRVQALLDEIDQVMEDEDAPASARESLIRQDTLVTTQFTVVGRLLPRQFDVLSNYGSLTIKLSDVRTARRDVPTKEEVAKTVEVQGANIANINWKSTTVNVEKGDQVAITADGSINLTPWGSRAMASPEGAANYGMFQPGGIAMGALVCKVGRDGPIFKVGGKHTFTADRAGALQFGVAIQPDYAGNNFPGQFSVKVRVKSRG